MAGDVAYSETTVRHLEEFFGAGFLSPAGIALEFLLEGVDLTDREVLDVGCGTGGPALDLVRRHNARSVWGVDVGAFQVERARARARDAGLADRLLFDRVEPGRLSFPPESFDVVFSADVIVHIEDKATIYREMALVSRPGAELVVSDHLLGDPRAQEAVDSCWAAGGYRATMATLEHTAELVRASGFANVRLEDLTAQYAQTSGPQTVPGPPEFADFMAGYTSLISKGAVRIVRIRARAR